MMNMPLKDIIAKIKEKSGLSEQEINKKIAEKLDSLSGLISKEGAAHIIANELGVKLMPEAGNVQIKSLLAGMRNVETVGKITKKFEAREFSKGERKGRVAGLMINDGTGSIRLVFWNDQVDKFNVLEEGDVLKLESGFVKDNQGRLEIHINTASKISRNPAGVKVDVSYDKPTKKKLEEIKEGDDNIEVLGTVVQVFDPRFFEVCGECGKRLSKKEDDFVCDVHGIVNPDYSYVLNIFLDDGTSNTRVVFWKNQFQRLLDLNDEQIKVFRESPADFEKVRTEMLGKFVKIIGRVNKNEGFDSLEIVAQLVFNNPDPKQEIKSLDAIDDSKSSKQIAEAVKEDDFEEVVSIDDLEDFKE